MQEPEIIEILLSKELQGLCTNCAQFEKCPYRKNTRKIIIQCELYELVDEEKASGHQETNRLKGLCVNCCYANTCCLPEKQFGVWHCEEYK
jgi:hypothetical protein